MRLPKQHLESTFKQMTLKCSCPDRSHRFARQAKKKHLYGRASDCEIGKLGRRPHGIRQTESSGRFPQCRQKIKKQRDYFSGQRREVVRRHHVVRQLLRSSSQGQPVATDLQACNFDDSAFAARNVVYRKSRRRVTASRDFKRAVRANPPASAPATHGSPDATGDG